MRIIRKAQGCFLLHVSMVNSLLSSRIFAVKSPRNGSKNPIQKNHLELFSALPRTSILWTLIRRRWKFRTCDDQLMIVQGVIYRAISPQDQWQPDMFPWDGSQKIQKLREDKLSWNFLGNLQPVTSCSTNNAVGSQKCDRMKLSSSEL